MLIRLSKDLKELFPPKRDGCSKTIFCVNEVAFACRDCPKGFYARAVYALPDAQIGKASSSGD